MKRRLCLLNDTLIVCLLLSILMVFSKCMALDDVSSSIREPLLLLSDDGPPHMIASTKSGIDIDITKDIVAQMGRELTITFSPLKRNREQVTHGQADMFVPTFYQQDGEHLFVSDPIIYYQPTVFSISTNNVTINHLNDIKRLRVTTFQGAKGYFGKEFVEMTEQNNYREIHDMSKLPDLLLAGRTDIVVLDYYIFYYFVKNNTELFTQKRQNIRSFSLIPPVSAHVGFHDKKLRDEFNVHLAKYLKQQKHLAVIKRYIGQ